MQRFNRRKVVLMLADMFILFISSILANLSLSVLNLPTLSDTRALSMTCSFTLIGFLALWVSGAYSKFWRYFNYLDYMTCVCGVAIAVFANFLIVSVGQSTPNWYYGLFCGIIATIGVTLFRLLFRRSFLCLKTLEEKNKGAAQKRTLIVGAGRATKLILGEILDINPGSDPEPSPYHPVCLVDDDSEKTGCTLHDIKIAGTTKDIPRLCKEENIEMILFAIPSCEEDDRKRILDLCSEAQLPIKVIPHLSQLMFSNDSTAIVPQMHDLKVEDLLGREPITFDKQDIRTLVHDRVCMITGGGGSIGSELTRQIAKYNPRQVIIVDIYENNAYEIQQELLMEYGDSLNLVTLIASVRDYYRMNQIFQKYHPDLVFHAAAHKHVPLMEVSPCEAIKNNVIGTFNVATLSEFYKVKKFVMISTDKAVNPTNVMGASKRCCEMVVQYLAQNCTSTEFITTRFGNVLGSNGSVIPLFKRQIEQGKAITVTHPDIIRYFMTIPEAVSLVLQAGAMASGGEIFVLDMGAPVKIVTLAENLIRMYGKEPYKDVEIKFTGLRPGEKLFEELLMSEEGLRQTANKKIFIGNQIKINEQQLLNSLTNLKRYANANNADATVACLADLVPTFKRAENKRKIEEKKLVTTNQNA